MRRITALIMVFLVITMPIISQDDCGNGLPCGPIPWNLPDLPILISPSPFPTVLYEPTATPPPVVTDVPTNTPAPTNTIAPSATIAATDISNQVSTLQVIIDATELAVNDGNYDELGANAGEFIGYVRGVAAIDLGFLNPLILAMVGGLGYVLSIKVIQFAAPLIAVFVGVIRKVIQFILGFIPGLG